MSGSKENLTYPKEDNLPHSKEAIFFPNKANYPIPKPHKIQLISLQIQFSSSHDQFSSHFHNFFVAFMKPLWVPNSSRSSKRFCIPHYTVEFYTDRYDIKSKELGMSCFEK